MLIANLNYESPQLSSEYRCHPAQLQPRCCNHTRQRPHLARDPVRTQLSEPERRRDLPEESDDVDVLDPALGVGVVLAPQPDELVEVVGAEDGPVTGQVVEVVHDDGHEEVEDEEGAAGLFLSHVVRFHGRNFDT